MVMVHLFSGGLPPSYVVTEMRKFAVVNLQQLTGCGFSWVPQTSVRA
jgi:hypothetical protein